MESGDSSKIIKKNKTFLTIKVDFDFNTHKQGPLAHIFTEAYKNKGKETKDVEHDVASVLSQRHGLILPRLCVRVCIHTYICS